MQVKDIMTASCRTVGEDTTIGEVATLMCLYDFSGLPVVKDKKLVGFIAEKDVLARLFPSVEEAMQGMSAIDFDTKAAEYRSLMSQSVKDLMVGSVTTVPADMPILKAAITMARNRFRRIPVADGDKLLGMLSLSDVHKALYHQSLMA